MNINLTTPINNLSYGIVGWNLFLQLTKLGHKVSLFPIGPIELPNVENDNAEEIGIFKSAWQNRNQSNYDRYAHSIRLYHQFDLSHHVGRKLHIGFTIFELNRLTPAEHNQVFSQDQVWVCSRWAKRVLGNYDNIKIVPLGVDKEIFYPFGEKHGDDLVFLNCGKWEVRKGHDFLSKVFDAAFTKKDKVRLKMLCYNPFHINNIDPNVEWSYYYKNSNLGDKIDILPRLKTQTEVAEIMRSVDVGIFPSRAEGWNLELLEMMACGKQVIATNYSAHTEYCTPENCRLIDVNSVENAYDGIWFNNEGEWAYLGPDQFDQCVNHMRELYKEKMENGFIKQNTAGISSAIEFSWENMARKVVTYLEG